MDTTTLPIEYHSDTPAFTDALKARLEKHLRKLMRGNRDITSASVGVQTDSGDTRPRAYRIRIVLYKKPANIAVVEQGETVAGTLTEAVETLKRLVREQRDRQREGWKHP